MNHMQPEFARRPEGTISRIAADRRRHKRIALTMLGRFMTGDRREFPCRLQDISAGGAAIMAPVDLPVGEKIIAYFDQLGGLEGSVCRVFEGGFAMTFNATQHKREKLVAQLTWMLNRGEVTNIEDRRHDRVIPHPGESTLQLDAGIVVPCKILNISLSGASITVTARPPIGHAVLLGKTGARVVRHHEHGISLEFTAETPEMTSKPDDNEA